MIFPEHETLPLLSILKRPPTTPGASTWIRPVPPILKTVVDAPPSNLNLLSNAINQTATNTDNTPDVDNDTLSDDDEVDDTDDY